ncbi:fructosyl amino acid [Colletotrichum karsti]|uniref:Fructosyl amino acid n=1 Tax=Colletotrichum karsti TaxID=1095194 RepID=A0A9P6HT80_9PEZI|nr:fructosyl amino acid [Colletotrichum karsti]KAF9870563.1 fructosyl amino acid [Colletotrichum karsti]
MVSKRTPKDAPIVIVGAGVFGLSTALELKKRGYRHITVIDRFLPPVPDGSSVDISRIIRVDYADPVYGQMARESYEGWNTQYSDHYHESGFVMLADRKGNSYLDGAKEVAAKSGLKLINYDDAKDIQKEYPSAKADFSGLQACINPKGGWADAKGAIAQMASECSQLGVHFIAGARGTVTSLKMEQGRVVGVNVVEGPPVLGEQVILATGAWTNRLIPITHASSASGQPVGFIQLTEEEAERLKDMPVMINFQTGVFVFPPTKGKNPILKFARHGYGYATEVRVGESGAGASERVISAPKRDGSNASSGYLPDDADEGLRDGVRQLAPEFASRGWINRRLCWYSDTPEGDFIMDYHPSIDGLFFATGGAGHAFKFLPVLGKYAADCFEEKASPELRHKWRLRESSGTQEALKLGDGSRGGPPLRKLTAVEQAKL